MVLPTPPSPSWSIPSTAPRTALAEFPTGPSRSARSMPTGRSARWCRTAPPVLASPRCAAEAPGVTAWRSSRRPPVPSTAPSSRSPASRPACCPGVSSGRSVPPRWLFATSRPGASTATSMAFPTSTPRGTTSARCSCARRQARRLSTPKNGRWSSSMPTPVASSSRPATQSCLAVLRDGLAA